MTDLIGRTEGMLWCNSSLGVPFAVRQITTECFELEFRTNRDVSALIAGISVTIEDGGNVILDYHGPSVRGTGSKILGNVLKPGWITSELDDE